LIIFGAPYGTRTRVFAVRERTLGLSVVTGARTLGVANPPVSANASEKLAFPTSRPMGTDAGSSPRRLVRRLSGRCLRLCTQAISYRDEQSGPAYSLRRDPRPCVDTVGIVIGGDRVGLIEQGFRANGRHCVPWWLSPVDARLHAALGLSFRQGQHFCLQVEALPS
jgi:hypothetical protein